MPNFQSASKGVLALATLMSLTLAAPALAEGKGHGNKHKNGHDRNVVVRSVAGHCPPGLAKKSPACIPPGQAKKMTSNDGVIVYRSGDIIDRDYILVRDPYRYGLPDGTYYRAGDYVYRVDGSTRQVLDIIGLANAILN